MSNKNASRRVARLALAASAAALLAACSSDIERLADYPPINETQSVASAGKVESSPLPPAGNAATPWRNPTPSWARTPSQSSASSYAAPVRQPVRTAAAPAAPAYAAPAPAVRNGVVIVQRGQTLYSIARANGKTVQELMAANGLSSPEIKVGQRIIIPGVPNPVSPAPTLASYQAPATPAAPRITPARAPAQSSNVRRTRTHRVQPGETLYALGRKYGVHPRKIAAANGFSLNTQLKVGQVVRIPASDGWSMAAAPRKAAPSSQAVVRKRSAQPRQVAQAPKPAPAPAPAKDEDRITPAPAQPAARPAQPAQSAPQVASARFVWPVQGRILAGFGQKLNGMKNEGINIAAPEGAPVRAAADGVVAYAGNELKGYGNLVLIRHPGGWVTAYAHNKELLVKRGDRVKRGQVIAKVGKTGSVKSAQLHFELRKGATPVNPLQHLGTMTAMR